MFLAPTRGATTFQTIARSRNVVATLVGARNMHQALPCACLEVGVFLMALPIILSSIQIEPLLAARQKGQQNAEVSPDLGISTVTATITPEGAIFPGGEQLTWQNI